MSPQLTTIFAFAVAQQAGTSATRPRHGSLSAWTLAGLIPAYCLQMLLQQRTQLGLTGQLSPQKAQLLSVPSAVHSPRPTSQQPPGQSLLLLQTKLSQLPSSSHSEPSGQSVSSRQSRAVASHIPRPCGRSRYRCSSRHSRQTHGTLFGQMHGSARQPASAGAMQNRFSGKSPGAAQSKSAAQSSQKCSMQRVPAGIAVAVDAALGASFCPPGTRSSQMPVKQSAFELAAFASSRPRRRRHSPCRSRRGS